MDIFKVIVTNDSILNAKDEYYETYIVSNYNANYITNIAYKNEQAFLGALRYTYNEIDFKKPGYSIFIIKYNRKVFGDNETYNRVLTNYINTFNNECTIPLKLKHITTNGISIKNVDPDSIRIYYDDDQFLLDAYNLDTKSIATYAINDIEFKKKEGLFNL